MSKLFCTFDETTGELTLSPYSIESPYYENNHITLGEMRGGKINKTISTINVLQNILFQAAIILIHE